MSIGLLGMIIKTLEFMVILSPKIFLLGIITRTKPYLYPVLLLTELVFIFIYSKITQVKTSFFGSILPSTYLPSLFDTSNTRSKFVILKKYCGALNCVVMHYALLILVYVPSYFLINYAMLNSGNDTNDFWYIEIFGFTLYATSILPYLGFLALYHYCGQRHKELYKKPAKDQNLEILSKSDYALTVIDPNEISNEQVPLNLDCAE